MELICVGNKSIHILNGIVVMVVIDPMTNRNGGDWKPMNKGKIQLQSEAAEVFYKDIIIKSITNIPGKYLREVKL